MKFLKGYRTFLVNAVGLALPFCVWALAYRCPGMLPLSVVEAMPGVFTMALVNFGLRLGTTTPPGKAG